LIAAGVRRFRITGGEPLLVAHVVDVVRYISEHGIDDLALTTNGSRLELLARPLRDAGLMRVNVSIDTLDPVRFAQMTRGGKLPAVLRGIEAARQVGFTPIKLNAVVLRGMNDDELESIVCFARERGLVPRFLEVMPIGEGAKLAPDHLVTVAEMRARLAGLLTDDAAIPEPDRGPARYVSLAQDPSFRVGFISGASDTFCGTCDRLRVSSTGVLRPCLATDDGVDAAAAPASEFQMKLEEAWAMKPDGRVFKGCTEPSARAVNMRAIGG
jgi:GTP 3',8-cyclase